MSDIIKSLGNSNISRRQLLTGASKVAASLAVASMGGLSIVSDANAAPVSKGNSFGFKKIDVDAVGKKAYEDYGKVFCAETVSSALIAQLAKEVGGQWKTFPLDALFWGHGGITGWGTACGTLIGAATVVGLSLDDKKVAERVVNDILAYYAYTTLPVYEPKEIVIAEIKSKSTANSPLCHISVGKWMQKENVKFFSNERKERCGRLSADISMYTATLLNQVADGTYKPSHEINALTYNITAQENCNECHGSNIPKVPGM